MPNVDLAHLEGLVITALAHRIKGDRGDLGTGPCPQVTEAAASAAVVADSLSACRLYALRMLSAYLCHDVSTLNLLTDGAMQQLGDLGTAPCHRQVTGPCPHVTDEPRAYLLFALFHTTHNPQFRDAAKDYVRSHPDCSPALHRYYALSKKVRVRLTDSATRRSLLHTAISGWGYQQL